MLTLRYNCSFMLRLMLNFSQNDHLVVSHRSNSWNRNNRLFPGISVRTYTLRISKSQITMFAATDWPSNHNKSSSYCSVTIKRSLVQPSVRFPKTQTCHRGGSSNSITHHLSSYLQHLLGGVDCLKWDCEIPWGLAMENVSEIPTWHPAPATSAAAGSRVSSWSGSHMLQTDLTST